MPTIFEAGTRQETAYAEVEITTSLEAVQSSVYTSVLTTI